jgi:outer membrane protein TolC
MRLRLVAMVVLLPAACANVRAARQAQDTASEVPGERTPAAAELGLPRTGQVTLRDAVRAALKAHPTVLQARHEAEAAQARCRAAEGQLLPVLTGNASLAWRDQKETGGHIQRRFQSAGFDVSWLLFDAGQTAAFARSAGEQWLAAQEELRFAEVEAAFGVRSAYFELSKQIQLAAVADETVRQFEVRQSQVHEFVQVGKRIPYDETKADLDLGNARLAQVKAKDAVLAAQATLSNAVGLAEVVDWSPLIDLPMPEMPPNFDAAMKIAVERQPALAAAQARERAASAIVDARIAALYPSLSVGGTWTGAGPDFPMPWAVSGGPSLRWVPFDGFQNLASIDESVASLRSARASRAKTEQSVWLVARTAWLGIEDAARRLDLTALNVRSAEENVELAQGLFDVGKATSVELTDAQQGLAQARADQVQARADRQAAAAQLARALGIAELEKP